MITLNADKVSVTGPKVDGSYSVKFEVGEYEVANVTRLMLLPKDEMIKLQVNAG